MQENNYIIVDGELYHYGVPGMRWGKRKARKENRDFNRLKKKLAKHKMLEKNTWTLNESIHIKFPEQIIQ